MRRSKAQNNFKVFKGSKANGGGLVTHAEIMAQFNDITRDSGRYYFTVAQVDRFINRALREVCERARYRDAYQEINAVAGTLEYAINKEGYDVFRVEYDGEVLQPIARDRLRHADRDWAQRSGTPKCYYLDEIYDSQEYLTVGIWEAPSSNLVAGLMVWYSAVPDAATYTKPSTELDVPDWAAGAILFYMLYLAYVADTKMQSFETAAIYKLMFEDILDRLIIRSNDRVPKKWVSGTPSSPNVSLLNRLPQRITE